MHLSQWVSKTNAGCFLEGFGGVQTDVPSLCIILQSQCLSLPREVPFVPGELCPCQKKTTHQTLSAPSFATQRHGGLAGARRSWDRTRFSDLSST